MQDNISLSEHFRLREFTESATARKHGIVNEPPPEAVENLRRLCEGCLEPLREALGLPIVITSGFRTKALNEILVHASRKSQHMYGQAADFHVAQGPVSGFFAEQSGRAERKFQGSSPADSAESADGIPGQARNEGLSHRELLIKAFRTIILDESIDFDQLILYPSFIHVSFVSRERNRRKITTANGQGTYCAVSREDALSISR